MAITTTSRRPAKGRSAPRTSGSRSAPKVIKSTARDRIRATAGRHTPSREATADSHSPAVDAYIAKAPEYARPILKHLRSVVHRACPDVVETIKWGMPSLEYKGPFAGFAAFKQHCVFGFWKHKLLDDPDGVLEKVDRSAMGNFGCIRSMKDLPSEATLARLVKAAKRLNDENVKLPRAVRKRKPLPVPPEFTKALSRNAKARSVFDGFSPSHRFEYLEWIVEAKRPETRANRIAQAIQWLSQGKHRNWKYER